MNGFGKWIQAARPKTLSAAWVPVLVGSALAARSAGQWSSTILVCALLCSLMIQVATNFFNDVIDFRKGADGAERLGPTRITAAGMASEKSVLRAALICTGLAVVLGLPLVLQGGWPILALGLASLFLAYGYTGGPFPLAYLGLGDLFVYLFFGLWAVGGTYFLHSGSLQPGSGVFLAGSQVGLWATALIAINNFRDSRQDRGNGKMTLAARFGATFSRVEITVLLLLPFTLGAGLWPQEGHLWAGVLPLLPLPLAFGVVKRVWREEPSAAFNSLLAKAGANHALTGLLLTIGLMIS